MPLAHWLIGSDQTVFVRGLRDVVTGNYLNNATVSAALRDADDEAVTGASNIVFTYRAGSSGDYVGNIAASAPLQEGSQYTLAITATAGSYTKTWRVTRVARHDGP